MLFRSLKDCPGCRAYLAQLYAIRDSFPTLDETQPPEGLADSVMATIRSQQVRRRARSRKMRTMVPLAACLAFLIVPGGTKGLFSGLDGAGNSAGEAALLSESSGDLSDAPFAAQSSPAGGSSFKGGVEQDTASENGGSSNSASLPKEAEPDSGTSAPKRSAGPAEPEAPGPAPTPAVLAHTAPGGKMS